MESDQSGYMDQIDEKLAPVSSFLKGFIDIDGLLKNADAGIAMEIQHINVDMPIELDITTDEYGKLVLSSAPPTQILVTTIMPVFHRVRFTLAKKHGEDK